MFLKEKKTTDGLKKAVTLGLMAALLLSAASPVFAAGAESLAGIKPETAAFTSDSDAVTAFAGYTDTRGHWAEEAINRWSEQFGVLLGYEDGTFRPDAGITRAELCVILDRVMGFAFLPEAGFDDVTGKEWYAESVLNLKCARIIFATEKKSYRPLEQVTREEAIKTFARAFDIPLSYDAVPYRDAGEISDNALGYISGMTRDGYVQGSDGLLHPKEILTRAQVVQILDNMVSGILTGGGQLTGDCSGNVIVRTDQTTALSQMTVGGNLYIAESVPAESLTLRDSKIGGYFKDWRDEDKALKLGEDVLVSEYDGAWVRFAGYAFRRYTEVPACRYDYDLLEYDNSGFPYYDGKRLVRGVDVSSWQETIDWNEVSNSGIDFAMLRVGYRGYQTGKINKDSRFQEYAEGALRHHVEIGAYFFSQAMTVEEARAEAEFVLEEIRGLPVTYPIVFDWELISNDTARTDIATPEIVTACAVEFCRVIAEAGYTPMIYSNTYTTLKMYQMDQIADIPFWMADYSETPKFCYDYVMWQFTDSGSVPGISGKADLNVLFRDIVY